MTIRPRRAEDVPALADVLAEQRPTSRYPFRWPLPIPIEQFVARDSDEAAWVAEVGGAVVGHVAVGTSVNPFGDEETEAFTAALGDAEIAKVSTLFTATSVRGHGLGGRLLDIAVDHIRATGRTPVLDVLPTHAPALELYRRRGWRTIAELRLDWLPAHAPALQLMALS